MKKHSVILVIMICLGIGKSLFATTNESVESSIAGSYCLTYDEVSIRLELYSNNGCSFLINDGIEYVTKTGSYSFDGETITFIWQPDETKEYGRYQKGVISRKTGKYTSKPSISILGYKLIKDNCK